LSKLQPHDEDLENFLDLSRRKQLENEKERSAATHSGSHSKNGDLAQQLSHESHEQPIEGTPQRDEPPLSRAEETALLSSAAAGESDGPPSTFQPDPRAQSEKIEPQILAEIELKTAAHIHETHPSPRNLIFWYG
jgi:hypothetical protein